MKIDANLSPNAIYNRRSLPCPPHLRISRHGPIKYITAYSVKLHDGIGATTHLGTFRSRHRAVAAATPLARELHVAVKGRWSGFYQQMKRTEYETRQRRIAERQIARRS
jgi:hypothetical protein